MPRQRGSIRPRGDGVWQVQVSITDPETGRRLRRFEKVTGDFKKAERRRTAMLKDLDDGIDADPGAWTLAKFVEERYLPDTKPRIRPRTYERYEALLVEKVLPEIGSLKLRDLRPTHIQRLVTKLQKEVSARGTPFSPRTVAQTYRVLHAALEHAVGLNILARNPSQGVKPPKPSKPKLNIPDAEVMLLLLAEAREAKSNSTLYLPLLVSTTTGLRRGEVLGLHWSDVDLEEATASVRWSAERDPSDRRKVALSEPKSDDSVRIVALPPMLVAALRRQKIEQKERRLVCGAAWADLDLVLDRGEGSPIHPDVFSRAFARLVKRLGLPHIRLHDIRHAYLTQLLIEGVPVKVVSEAAGHSTTAFTQDTYQHVIGNMGRQTATAIEAALGGEGG